MADYTDIDKLRELAETATPGPWSAADEHGLLGPDASPAWCVSRMTPDGEYMYDIAYAAKEIKDHHPDFEFIATCSPDVILALVAELVGLRTEVDQLRRENANMHNTRDEWMTQASANWSPAAHLLANEENGRLAVERDALQARIDAIREARSCLGAGPMDYEAFTDEVDRILAAGAALGVDPQKEDGDADKR